MEVEAALEDLEEGPGLFILALGVGEQRQRSLLILALRSDEPVAQHLSTGWTNITAWKCFFDWLQGGVVFYIEQCRLHFGSVRNMEPDWPLHQSPALFHWFLNVLVWVHSSVNFAQLWNQIRHSHGKLLHTSIQSQFPVCLHVSHVLVWKCWTNLCCELIHDYL